MIVVSTIRTIPGFKSGKWWKMIFASIGYLFIFLTIMVILFPTEETTTTQPKTTETSREFDELKLVEIFEDISNIDVYKDKIVFNKGEFGYNSDVFIYDTFSKETTQITFDNSDQYYPRIYGDVIVWSDNRFGYGKEGEFFIYNISTGEERPIGINISEFGKMDFDDDVLVWPDWDKDTRHTVWYLLNLTSKEKYLLPIGFESGKLKSGGVSEIYKNKIIGLTFSDNYDSDIFIYDITKNSTTILKRQFKQEQPDIYENIVVWSDNRNGRLNWDIYMYDLSSDEEIHLTKQQDTAETQPKIYGNVVVYIKYKVGSGGYAENEQLIMYNLSTGEEKAVSTSCGHIEKIYKNRILCGNWDGTKWITYLYVF